MALEATKISTGVVLDTETQQMNAHLGVNGVVQKLIAPLTANVKEDTETIRMREYLVRQ